MGTHRLPPLTSAQGQELARIALEHPQENVRRRAHALLLLYNGHSVVAVAHQLSVARRSLYHWMERLRTDGVEGIDDPPQSRRPAQVTDDYLDRLEFLLSRDPYEYHREFPSYTPKSGWTARRLIKHLEADTGIAVSLRQMRQLLTGLDYHFGAKHVIRVTRMFVPSFFDLQQPDQHLGRIRHPAELV